MKYNATEDISWHFNMDRLGYEFTQELLRQMRGGVSYDTPMGGMVELLNRQLNYFGNLELSRMLKDEDGEYKRLVDGRSEV